MDISYTKEFKNYVNAFCKHIKEQVNLIIKRHEDTEGKVYFCAISRKTPKLMDLLHEQLGSIWNSLEIITEFTIPFIDWTKVKVLLLADDAIYYGSTFLSVYQFIQKYAPDTKIIPLCCIKASELPLPFNEELLTTVVERTAGHYFVNCLSMKFATQCTPFEIEFPVFEVRMATCSRELLKDFVRIRDGRSYKVYQISSMFDEKDKRKNYTFGINVSETNNICRKIRGYYKNGSLLLSCICANSLQEEEIKSSQLFDDTIYKELWNKILEVFNNRQLGFYELRILTTAANFLYSLDMFSYYWTYIQDELKELTDDVVRCKLRTRELRLLFGSKIAGEIIKWWEEIGENLAGNVEHVFDVKENITNLHNEIFPQNLEYKDYYLQQQAKLMERFVTEDDTLMSLFYIQNAMLDKMNRTYYTNRYERLHYGHTIGSLLYLLRKKYSLTNNLEIKLHKWLDSQIDKASIVPQYIRIQNNSGMSWIRAFRSGENEMYFVSHWARLCAMIARLEMDVLGFVSLDKRLFNDILSWIYKECELNRYSYQEVNIIYENHCYQLVEVMNGNKNPVIDTLIKLDIFRETGNNQLVVNHELIMDEINSGTILPQEVTDLIHKKIKDLHALIPDIFTPFCYVLYFSTYFAQKPLEVKLEEGIKVLSVFFSDIQNNKGEDDSNWLIAFQQMKSSIDAILAESVNSTNSGLDSSRHHKDLSLFKDYYLTMIYNQSNNKKNLILKIIGYLIVGGSDCKTNIIRTLRNIEQQSSFAIVKSKLSTMKNDHQFRTNALELLRLNMEDLWKD